MLDSSIVTTYAYCLGANIYNNAISSLKCAERDAKDLTNFFKKKCGFTAEDLKKKNIEYLVSRIAALKKQLLVGDVFIFYFAGHGKIHNNDQYFLLPGCHYESLEKGNLLNGGVLSLNSLKSLTSEAQWQGVHRIFIFDTCRNSLTTENDNSGCDDGKSEYLVRAAFGKKKAHEDSLLTVIDSCDKGQFATELPKRGNGLFTAALLDELENQSCIGREITIDHEFIENLGQRMAALAKTYNLDHLPQHPVLHGDPAYLPLQPTVSQQERDARNWRLAYAINTVAAYKEYVENAPPDAAYIEQALTKIEAITKEQSIIPENQPDIPAPRPETKQSIPPTAPGIKFPPQAHYTGAVVVNINGIRKMKVTLTGRIGIGRSRKNEIIINPNDKSASGVNSYIFELNGKPMVCDNESTNGTFLNGVQIHRPEPISDGDCIRVGMTYIRIFYQIPTI